MERKCAVLFSDGLDSRLAVKIMQAEFRVYVLHFVLPFSKNVLKSVKKFCKEQKVQSKIFDCTRGKLLKEYLNVLENAKFGRGVGFNPCVDCKIFMLKKAREFAKRNRIDFIATGEVEGQRPMSQTKKSLRVIEEQSGLGKKLLRPVSEIAFGRKREKQIALAKKFRIDFPHPAGGCLLCEKALKKRFEFLMKNKMINSQNLKLVNIGRHFFTEGCWFVVARDADECRVVEMFKGNFIEGKTGMPSVYFSKRAKKFREIAKSLQEAYRTGASEKERKVFDWGKL